jgi:hypothetical protein
MLMIIRLKRIANKVGIAKKQKASITNLASYKKGTHRTAHVSTHVLPLPAYPAGTLGIEPKSRAAGPVVCGHSAPSRIEKASRRITKGHAAMEKKRLVEPAPPLRRIVSRRRTLNPIKNQKYLCKQDYKLAMGIQCD